MAQFSTLPLVTLTPHMNTHTHKHTHTQTHRQTHTHTHTESQLAAGRLSCAATVEGLSRSWTAALGRRGWWAGVGSGHRFEAAWCVCERRLGTGSCVSVRQTTTMVFRGVGRAFLCLSVCLSGGPPYGMWVPQVRSEVRAASKRSPVSSPWRGPT